MDIASMWTRPRLTADLQRLGVETGDLLFIHSSYKSIGPVDGGAGTVVSALEDTVGTTGLVLMPSFNLVREDRQGTWDISSSPSTVGWLTEYFRRMPGTYRSDHYSHSVTARGAGSEAFITGHRRREGLRSPWDREPWGKTYGVHSPMYRAYERDGKLLMLGVNYESSTYVHVVEAICWNRQLAADSRCRYVALDRPAMGDFWDGLGRLHRGGVGDSACRLFSIRDYVDTLVAEAEANPDPYVLTSQPKPPVTVR